MAKKKRRKPRRKASPARSSRSGDIINIKVMDYDLPIVPLLIVGGLIALAARKGNDVQDERQMLVKQ